MTCQKQFFGDDALFWKHRWNIAIFRGNYDVRRSFSRNFRNPSGSHGPVGEAYSIKKQENIEHIDHNSARFLLLSPTFCGWIFSSFENLESSFQLRCCESRWRNSQKVAICKGQ